MTTTSANPLLKEALQKRRKTTDDAQFIYENIRSIRFFESFFAQSLKTLDLRDVVSLCRRFSYESYPEGKLVFRQGDQSNNKLYVILSGRARVIITDEKKKLLKAKKIQELELKKQLKTQKQTVLPREAIQEPARKSVEPEHWGHHLSKFREKRNSLFMSLNISPRHSFNMGVQTIGSQISSIVANEATNSGSDPVLTSEDGSKATVDDDDEFDEVKMDEDEEEREGEDQEEEGESDENIIKSGKVVYEKGPGEGFGEIALKENIPRTASILCSTDCEFLIVTKEQYDGIFLKKEYEKEFIIKDTFPMLRTMSTKKFNFNYIFSSFQCFVYRRGNYITTQDKTIPKNEGKIYIIQEGECVVEKNFSLEIGSPLAARCQAVASTVQPLQITQIGQGEMFGEEILRHNSRYEYSIKALSETVIIQAIRKADFVGAFPKEIQDHVVSQFEIKRSQRGSIFENMRIGRETKLEQFKADNIYCVQNIKIANVLNKAVIQTFSRSIKREQQNTPSPRTGTLPTISTPQIKESISSPKNFNEGRMSVRRHSIMSGISGLDMSNNSLSPKNLQGDNSSSRIMKPRRSLFCNTNQNGNSTIVDEFSDNVNSVILNVAKGIKKYKQIDEGLVDVKGIGRRDQNSSRLEDDPRDISSHYEKIIPSLSNLPKESSFKRRLQPLQVPDHLSPKGSSIVMETPKGSGSYDLDGYLSPINANCVSNSVSNSAYLKKHKYRASPRDSPCMSSITCSKKSSEDIERFNGNNTPDLDFLKINNAILPSDYEESLAKSRSSSQQPQKMPVLATINFKPEKSTKKVHILKVNNWRKQVFKKVPRPMVAALGSDPQLGFKN